MPATELHLAAFDGDTNRVKRFLSEGADVNARTNNDLTPLLLAAMHGKADTVRALLDAGAGANHGLGSDSASIPTAAAPAHVEVLDMALQSGSIETLRALLEAGYSPQIAETLMPVSLLMVASMTTDDPEVPRLLSKYGAKADAMVEMMAAHAASLPEMLDPKAMRAGQEARRNDLLQTVRANLVTELAAEKGG